MNEGRSWWVQGCVWFLAFLYGKWCSSYFIVIKHNDQAKFSKKEFCVVLWFQRDKRLSK